MRARWERIKGTSANKPRLETEQTVILSHGAGVNTTAMLIKFWKRYLKGYIVFADTGDEKKETYWYIENYLKPFCKEKGLRWKTVKNSKYDSLMDWCLKKKLLPMTRTRQCTQDFKIRPIQRFVKKVGATKKNPFIQDIGFAIDEIHRVSNGKFDVNYLKSEYPLLDHKLTRRDCHKIIEDHGWPVPVKSGCDFCPFAKRSQFKKLMIDDPERFKKIMAMEQNDRNYPKYPLDGRAILAEIWNGGENLDNFMEEEEEDEEEEQQTCDSGHCFV